MMIKFLTSNIREKLHKYLDDLADTYIAVYRLVYPAKTISLEEMQKEFEKS